MPRVAGMAVEPRRERDRERKGAAGADEAGVMEKRLEAKAAPSGALVVTGGISPAMIELRGRARPRTPLNVGERGSSVMLFAAAVVVRVGKLLVRKW
jgi:hypothetical protein